MWLAGHTYSFRSLPLADALGRLLDLGFDDVELWLGHATNPDDAADVVARAGVRVRAVSAGGFYEAGDDTPERAAELATAVGADVVVMCVAPRLVFALERLSSSHIRVAVENHWDQPLARSHEVAAAISTSTHGACLDTGHALAAGERPETFVRALRERVTHLHLKEGRLPSLRERVLGRRLRRRFLGRPEPLPPGDGDLDLRALQAELLATGFEGYVTLEHEGERQGEALAALAAAWRAALER